MLLRFILRPITSNIKRNVLSKSYLCDDIWNERLKTFNVPIDKTNFMSKLENDYANNVPVSNLDYDILMCSINEINTSNFNILKSIIYKHRTTEESINAFESSSHAIIRNLIDKNDIDFVYSLIREKSKSGVFLDEISVNILLDKFISLNLWEKASFIAAEWLFQEDFYSSNLGMTLSLYVLMEYYNDTLLKPIDNVEEPIKQMDDKIEYKFVKFLPSNYFDNHFDLLTEQHIGRMVGKCLIMLSDNMSLLSNDMKMNLKLLGLFLYQDLNNALKFTKNWLNKNKDVEIYSEFTENIPIIINNYDRIVNVEDEDLKPNYSMHSEEDISNGIEQFKNLISQFPNKKSETSLLEKVRNIKEENLNELMSSESKMSEEKYRQFNENRSEVYKKTQQIEYELKTVQEAKKKLRELTDREEMYRYFENIPEVLYKNWLAVRTKEEKKFNIRKNYNENLSNLKVNERKKFLVQHEESE